jgi:natural product biosynthesis luciferase-like monooxygenase protein
LNWINAVALEAGCNAGMNELSFSLYYFASHEGGPAAASARRLLFDSARFADHQGFEALWFPERHFHAFGGLSPNPSVMAAAMASITQRVRLRSGSVVVPLHHPARVVEEWSLVDLLSGGRVDLGLASGWFPNDFVLAAPGTYEQRSELVFERAAELQRLWRGEPFTATNPLGDAVSLQTMPRPLQRELPLWITAAGNPATFERAGAAGHHVLTHLLGQSLDALERKVQAYRDAWRSAGHAGHGRVTLMLHTFVGEDDAAVRRTVKGPMLRYLESSANLVGGYTASVPFFQQRCPAADGPLSADDVRDALEFSFERYYATSSLLGTLDKCLETTDRLRAIGVDEVACLIDFGVEPQAVLDALPLLTELKELANVDAEEGASLSPTV